MIEPFEKALKERYVPAMVPGVRDVKIVPAGPEGIYLNKNQKTFPYAIIAKPTEPIDFTRKYVDTDDAGATVMCMPFISRYELHVYIKNQRDAVMMIQHLALQSKRNPYVVFGYRNVPDFRIGLWTTNLTQQQVDSEYSDKGGCVDVAWMFHANLVLTSIIKAPIIKSVKVGVSAVDVVNGNEKYSYDVSVNSSGNIVVTPGT